MFYYVCFIANMQVAFGMDLDLVNNDSPFPKAIEICLKGMVANLRDLFFQVLRGVKEL